MGLFGLFSKKKPTKKSVSKKADSRPITNSFGQRLDRLTPDNDLPYGWVSANIGFINKIEDEYKKFLADWLNSKHKSPNEKYTALKSLLVYMDDVKKLCASLGECFDYWRDKTLLSDNEIKELTTELEYIKENYDDLTDEYQREQYIKCCILPEIPKIIKANPGILQTDIYKMYPVDCKIHISSELYNLSYNGQVIREKSGRTYSLTIGKAKKKARA